MLQDSQAQISTIGWLIAELAVGTLFLVVIMLVHGTGVRAISGRFTRLWVTVTPATPGLRINLLMAFVIGGFTALHLFETLLWAILLVAIGAMTGMRDSYYFVLESYTTLGEGSLNLPDAWRLLGPMMAISGLFTFGWTGSVLVAIMTELFKFDRSRAEDRKD